MSEPVSRMNHNLAILAVLLALAGVFFASYGPWLVLPSLISAWLAWRAIRREPQRYTGILFIYGALVLNLVMLVLFGLYYLA